MDLEGHPELLREPDTAFAAACASWAARGCNALADRDDVVGSTKRVNGGTNGLADRKAYLAKGKPIFAAAGGPIVVSAKPAKVRQLRDLSQGKGGEVWQLQTRLKALGYRDVGNIDGDVGDRTEGAVVDFKRVNGMPLNFDMDEATLAKFFLPNAKPKPISTERGQADAAFVEKSAPGLLEPAKAQQALAVGGGGIFTALGVGKLFSDVSDALRPLKDVLGDIPLWMVGVAVAIFAVMGLAAWLGQRRIIAQAQTGALT